MNKDDINSDLVRKLREREAAFQRYKILLLVGGISQIAAAVFFALILQKYHRLFQGIEMGVVLVSLFVGVMILSFFVGWCLVLVCIRDWGGDATRLLLLQMIARENNRETLPNNSRLEQPAINTSIS